MSTTAHQRRLSKERKNITFYKEIKFTSCIIKNNGHAHVYQDMIHANWKKNMYYAGNKSIKAIAIVFKQIPILAWKQ